MKISTLRINGYAIRDILMPERYAINDGINEQNTYTVRPMLWDDIASPIQSSHNDKAMPTTEKWQAIDQMFEKAFSENGYVDSEDIDFTNTL